MSDAMKVAVCEILEELRRLLIVGTAGSLSTVYIDDDSIVLNDFLTRDKFNELTRSLGLGDGCYRNGLCLICITGDVIRFLIVRAQSVFGLFGTGWNAIHVKIDFNTEAAELHYLLHKHGKIVNSWHLHVLTDIGCVIRQALEYIGQNVVVVEEHVIGRYYKLRETIDTAFDLVPKLSGWKCSVAKILSDMFDCIYEHHYGETGQLLRVYDERLAVGWLKIKTFNGYVELIAKLGLFDYSHLGCGTFVLYIGETHVKALMIRVFGGYDSKIQATRAKYFELNFSTRKHKLRALRFDSCKGQLNWNDCGLDSLRSEIKDLLEFARHIARWNDYDSMYNSFITRIDNDLAGV